MSKTINKLKNNIMSRVYFTYVFRLLKHPLATHGAVLIVSGYLLIRLVHVAAVYHNILNVRIGDIGNYLYFTLTRADATTLLVVGVVLFTVLSLRWRLHLPVWSQPHQVA